jgi:hypothetical protein
MSEKPKRGAPQKPADQRVESNVHLRCKRVDKALWIKALAGDKFAPWVIATLNREAKKLAKRRGIALD